MSSAFVTVTRAYASICVFRLGPQDLPRSGALLLMTVPINLALSILLNHQYYPPGAAVITALLEFTIMIGLTAALLTVFRYPRRVLQTITALMGAGAIITAVPLLYTLIFGAVSLPARLLLLAWNLLVIAHILRHAANVHMAAGFIFAIGYAAACDGAFRLVLLNGG